MTTITLAQALSAVARGEIRAFRTRLVTEVAKELGFCTEESLRQVESAVARVIVEVTK